jgi:hypothetical protein
MVGLGLLEGSMAALPQERREAAELAIKYYSLDDEDRQINH